MNVPGITRVIGSYLYVMALLLAIGAGVSVYFEYFAAPDSHLQPHVTSAFIKVLFLCVLSAYIMRWATKDADRSLQLKEAIVAVIGIWVLTIFFSALPYTLGGILEHHIDSWFEAVSALTTTGCSIMHPKAYDQSLMEVPITKIFHGFQHIEYSFYGTVKPVMDSAGNVLLCGVEALPRVILFWRAFLAWIGGLGVVFLFVAFIPALGQRGRMLFRYESTGPVFSQLFAQARKSALVLFAIYMALTLCCISSYLYALPQMGIFEAVCTSLATLSTGGFTVRNAGIAAYNCLGVEVVAMIFMVLAAINIALFYELIRGRIFKVFTIELVTFIALLAVMSFIVSLNIIGTNKFTLPDGVVDGVYSISEGFRYGIFQVIQAFTTTGFATADYDQWPFLSQTILLVVMYLGGMAGSTAGGLKIIRVCILFQCARHAISSVFKREQVRPIRVGKRDIDNETAFGVLSFFLIMMGTSLVGLLGLVACGIDPETALGLNASLINNVGAQFRMAGPVSSCAFLTFVPKCICIGWMLLGRLEFYIWFALFLPSFWKSD